MANEPTYEELAKRVEELEKKVDQSRQVEKALRSSEEKFRTIAGTTRDAIMMVGSDGRISYWNRASERIFGYSSEEAMGEALSMIIPERYFRNFWRGMNAFKKTGEGPAIGMTVESEALKKDGAEIPIELSISAVQLKGQWHAVGIARDITDRRRMEKNLRERLEKYQLVFDYARDAILLGDLETQKIIEVNRPAIEMYGYSREDFLTLRTADVSAEPKKRKIGQSARNIYVSKHRRKDGTVFPVEISVCAFMWKNRKTFCAVARDISERKRKEKGRAKGKVLKLTGR